MTPIIAILGAGPSGLTLARLLHQNNIDYIVYERDASSAAVGGGGTLDLHTGTGLLALEKAGLFDQFKSLARYEGQAMKTLDSDANVIWNMESEGQEGRPEIDRKVLRQLLLDSIPADRIKWGYRVESVYRDTDDSIAVRFDNSEVEKGFILLVGADGAWSKARSLRTSAKPRYSGVSYLQTSIQPSNPIYDRACKQCGHGMYMSLTAGRSITIQRLGDGSYNIYLGLLLPENWHKTEAELFRSPNFREHVVAKEYADWSSEITDLVKYSDGEFHAWPLFSLPVDAMSWQSTPGLTLLGDAAHLALPNGEGVNCGMYDSLQLVEELLSFGLDNLDEAVKSYEEKMVPRAVEHIKDGDQMQAMFHAEDAPRGFKEWVASMTGEAV